jgi:toxin ParE1/3/4
VSHGLHPAAEAELGDAAHYYATQASRAIADAFLAEYERVIQLLVENPQRGPHLEGRLRVYHFDRFPFCVIDDVNVATGPRIFAVAHQRREPGYWGGRTASSPGEDRFFKRPFSLWTAPRARQNRGRTPRNTAPEAP